jgi:predicted transcriptional regulator
MYRMARQSQEFRIRTPLTELESDVMNAVWNAGSSSVEDVHRAVARTRDLKETTVRTLLRRLEQKGYLTHKSEGRAYFYTPKESPSQLAGRAVRQIIDRFCRGSVRELVSGMVDGEMLTDEELTKLEEFARNRRASE